MNAAPYGLCFMGTKKHTLPECANHLFLKYTVRDWVGSLASVVVTPIYSFKPLG